MVWFAYGIIPLYLHPSCIAVTHSSGNKRKERLNKSGRVTHLIMKEALSSTEQMKIYKARISIYTRIANVATAVVGYEINTIRRYEIVTDRL